MVGIYLSAVALKYVNEVNVIDQLWVYNLLIIGIQLLDDGRNMTNRCWKYDKSMAGK